MELVRPEVPDAQKNLAPQYLLEGLRGGLAAFAQMASIRRQSEADVARLALQEKLASQQHDLDARRMAQSYELDDRRMKVAEEMLPYQKEASAAQTDLKTQHAKAFAEGTATAAQMKAETAKQKTMLMKEVSDRARELKLDDPHFQTKNPMEFAKNVLEFGRQYHLTTVPEIRAAIKGYQSVADEQKLFIRHGVEGEDGVVKGTGNGRQVPAWRIVSNAQNPATRDQTLMDLEASGYTDLVQGFQQMTDKSGKKVQVPTKTRMLKQPVRAMMEEASTFSQPEESESSPAAPPEAESAEKPMPDYGPEPTPPKYPVGTRGKRGGAWFVLNEEGWKPE